jgi:succinyl-CoA synthetase alpha subunit
MTQAQFIARACRIAIATPVIAYIIGRFAYEFARMSPQQRAEFLEEAMYIFKVEP